MISRMCTFQHKSIHLRHQQSHPIILRELWLYTQTCNPTCGCTSGLPLLPPALRRLRGTSMAESSDTNESCGVFRDLAASGDGRSGAYGLRRPSASGDGCAAAAPAGRCSGFAAGDCASAAGLVFGRVALCRSDCRSNGKILYMIQQVRHADK